MIDFNTEPYNDDYDENSKFYRILFRPSFAVQARELTQLQTILQNQIARHGNHIFKQGSMVVPGQISIDTSANYVKLQPLYNGVAVETFINELQGKTVVGANQGLTAEIIKVQSQQSTEPTTIYVRYTSSGNNSTTKVFANEEVITTSDGLYSFQAQAVDSTGLGTIVSIERGIYYVNNFFVLVDAHSLVVDKYGTTPSFRVGLAVTESTITPEDDETLLDNAQNSYNFAAPGAHRYYIDLQLAKLPLESVTDNNFIELLRIEDGVNRKIVSRTEYSILEETLARRTYDESGDYTIRNFNIDVREHRTNDRGQWTQNTAFLIGDVVTNAGRIYVAKNSGTSVTTAPVHTSGTAYDGPGSTGIQWELTTTPSYNRGIFKTGDESKLAIGLEPGKAYVRGYEIEKIATEYVAVNKARDFVQADNAFTSAELGAFVVVTNLTKIPLITTNQVVTLQDRITATRGTPAGTAIGTARVRAIEYDNGVLGNTAATYKLFLYNIEMASGKSFERHVKQIAAVSAGFTADINPILTPRIGSVTSSGTAVTGTGTSFLTDLVVGDYIRVGTTNHLVTAIASQTALTLDAGTPLTTTGSAFSLVETNIIDAAKESSNFKLPYPTVKSVRSALGTNDTRYTVTGYFTGVVSSGTLTINASSGTFASGTVNGNFIVARNDNGDIVPATVTVAGSSATINVGTPLNGVTCIIIAVIEKTGAGSTEKSKTHVTGVTATFTTATTATAQVLSLGKADCWKINSILMDTGSFASPSGTYSIDISDRYDFDNGQRSTHYDLGRIILKDTYAPPSAPIRVTFEHFTHTSGDYCTVNSFPATIPYDSIPTELRDGLDFRPRMDDNGNFSVVTLLPKRGSTISTDFTYYLARNEKIAVDISGEIFSISGTSSLSPGEPEDPATGMVLYKLRLDPYTFNTNSVRVESVDNRRYTMRDIGKLEKRIDNLEYYTSLSLLEQQTESLTITDSSGLNRFKNGFTVDNFTGHSVGQVSSPDYRCAIDMENGELRPFYSMRNVNLVERASTPAARAAAFYQQHSDVITLPILENVELVKQNFASRLENINPFAVFTFLGNVKLNPQTDDWFEVDRRPDIINNIDGNFSTMSILAEKAGALGTVWNAWQTQWTGTPVSQGTTGGFGRGFWQIRETFATEIGQSRTGIKTSLVPKVDHQIVADRVLSTAVIPYIRSRNILVQIRGLKPKTRFYPFFDNVDISAYCTPATKITYTSTGVFDTDTNVGGVATEAARRIAGDTQVCLNRGDFIRGVTSNATAVVVGSDLNKVDPLNPATWVKTLHVVNIIGTFQNGEQFTGSVSNAVGQITSVGTIATAGSNIITNQNGDVNLIFNIPNTESVRFRTGSREFKLVDVPQATGAFTSRGRANYRAEGVVETKQSTVNAVRNAELVQEAVQDTQTIVENSTNIIAQGWYDPLAQSFLIDNKGGAFLTKVDIFFASKDNNIPVTMEIRECVNGYPGKRVLPFSRVTLKPEQVVLSTNTVDLDGVDTPSYDTPTSFVFPSPVYVQDKGEYAIVLLSDCNNYKVWISQLGDAVPGTSRTISEQPYLGSLFKSQNASTWTADQTQDLKFTIYKAKFDTSAVGTVQFVNDVLPYTTLEQDPFQMTAGSNIVRVWHPNHGLTDNSRVIITGVSGALNGIPANQLNGTWFVSNIDLDSYTITTTATATATGYFGGSSVRATGQVQFDAFQPSAQIQSFSETSVSYGIKTTSGKSVDGSEAPYVQDVGFLDCLANSNNYVYSPRVVASEVNENNFTGGNKSLTFAVNMSSTNDSLSPVLDTQRMSLTAISNRINSATNANTNVTPVDFTTVFTGATGAFSFSGSTITSSVTAVTNLMQTIGVGHFIRITNATTAGNNGQFLVTDVQNTTGSTWAITVSGVTFTSESAVSGTTVASINLFTDDISPIGSSSASKYVTKPVKLTLPSTFLKVRFAANIPSQSDVLVYYKTSLGSTGTLDKTKYTLASPVSAPTKVENGNESFYDVDYSLTNLVPFDAVQVKLVMKSTNSSAVPRIKDLRIIACA